MAQTRADKYTAVNATTERYSDFTVNLDPHPHTNQVVRIVAEDAVLRSVRNLILGNRLEYIRQPNKGSRIQSMLFDLITDQTTNALQSEIKDTLLQEPRIRVDDVIVIPDSVNHLYDITIKFSLINRAEPLTLNFALNRIR